MYNVKNIFKLYFLLSRIECMILYSLLSHAFHVPGKCTGAVFLENQPFLERGYYLVQVKKTIPDGHI
jgi:hypothetical protein